jgi:hypothetical protein
VPAAAPSPCCHSGRRRWARVLLPPCVPGGIKCEHRQAWVGVEGAGELVDGLVGWSLGGGASGGAGLEVGEGQVRGEQWRMGRRLGTGVVT